MKIAFQRRFLFCCGQFKNTRIEFFVGLVRTRYKIRLLVSTALSISDSFGIEINQSALFSIKLAFVSDTFKPHENKIL